jgi:hypothetical protein
MADPEPKTGIAYGSLYYDRGERIGKAEEQIHQVSKQKPIGWFFDIICTKNQVPQMEGMRMQVLGLVRRNNPDMPDDNIFISWNVKKIVRGVEYRPAQKQMIQLFEKVNKKK